MIATLFRIRMNQFWRVLEDVGIVRVLVLGAFIGFPLIGGIKKVAAPELHPVVAIVWALILCGIHFQRPDKSFLKLVGSNPFQVYLVEYFLLSLPVIGLLVFYGGFLWAASLLPFLVLLSALNFTIGKRQVRAINMNWIPVRGFEWKSGMRKNGLLFILFFLLGIGLAFTPFMIPISIAGFGIVAASFYLEGESVMLLRQFADSPKGLLRKKIADGSLWLSFGVLPLAVVYVCLHPQFWFIPLVLWIAGSLLISFAILIKYALFEPGQKLEKNGMILALFGVFLFIPFLLPAALFLWVRQYGKAMQSLKPHFDV